MSYVPGEPGECTRCHGSGNNLQAIRDALAALQINRQDVIDAAAKTL